MSDLISFFQTDIQIQTSQLRRSRLEIFPSVHALLREELVQYASVSTPQEAPKHAPSTPFRSFGST